MKSNSLKLQEKQLVEDLSYLVELHGFSSILSVLEQLASDRTNYSNMNWEAIRKNLEDSYLEIEEWNITGEMN